MQDTYYLARVQSRDISIRGVRKSYITNSFAKRCIDLVIEDTYSTVVLIHL